MQGVHGHGRMYLSEEDGHGENYGLRLGRVVQFTVGGVRWL